MFFGLINLPAIFQGFMNYILKELIDEGHVIVYLDNILIFTLEVKTYRYLVQQVLKILQENKLYLKLEKCTFKV